MIKTDESSLIKPASDTYDETVIYRRGWIQCRRSYYATAEPETEVMCSYNNSMKNSVKAWHSLHAEDKALYYKRAARSKRSHSGYHLFARVNKKEPANRS